MTAGLTGFPGRFTAAAIMAGLISGCGGPDAGPEEAIRAWVKRGHAAAEARDRGALIDMMSPAYADARGNSRDDIENMLRLYFLRQQKVALITRIDELAVHGGSAADLVLQLGMAGTNDDALGFSADAYRIDMELERDGDDWLLIAARWAGLGGEAY